MTDATLTCPVCSAKLPARARFCGECGAAIRPAGASPGSPGSRVLPWFLAGCTVLAVHATVIIVALRRGATPQPIPASSAAPFASGGGMTDISNMTPREAADRLYERIARASEAGDTGQVRFFAPMAFNAYANVDPLDADARLHIGLIHLAVGDAAAARAQGDSIVRFSATHLFGPVLRARAAAARGDNAALREAYRAFLTNYESERRKNLPEYGSEGSREQHDRLLTETRAAAQRVTGSR